MIHTYKGSLVVNGKCHFSFKIKIKLLKVAKNFGLKKNSRNYKLQVIILTKIKHSTQKKTQAKYISVSISSNKFITTEKTTIKPF